MRKPHSLNLNRQFDNRLFDRDTLLLNHYDVNFLFIVALYGRNKKSAQAAWRAKVREQFRKEIQSLLNEMYSFHVLQPKAGKDCYAFVKNNFSVLNGKIYRPAPDANYLVLAELKKAPTKENVKTLLDKANVNAEESPNYKAVKSEMADYFDITENVEINADGGFRFEKIAESGSLEKKEEKKEREGIAFVMFENMKDRLHDILKKGKVAIGLNSVSSLELYVHKNDIRYIMFHTWNNDTYKVYEVLGDPIMDKVAGSAISTNTASTYLILELVTWKEANLTHLNLKAVEHDRSDRYDSRFAFLDEL